MILDELVAVYVTNEGEYTFFDTAKASENKVYNG